MHLTLEQRTAALLALVEEHRVRRCAALLDPARERARSILRAARGEGRRRVHASIGELRQRLAAEVGAAQARAATERRLAEQRQAMVLLRAAWSDLRAALQRRWREPAARQAWLAAQLQRARLVLAGTGEPWRIDHAADWPDDERAAVLAGLAAAGIRVEATRPCEDIAGGVRIRAGANLVDATVDGLLADRAAVEGRLLELLRAHRERPR